MTYYGQSVIQGVQSQPIAPNIPLDGQAIYFRQSKDASVECCLTRPGGSQLSSTIIDALNSMS